MGEWTKKEALSGLVYTAVYTAPDGITAEYVVRRLHKGKGANGWKATNLRTGAYRIVETMGEAKRLAEQGYLGR